VHIVFTGFCLVGCALGLTLSAASQETTAANYIKMAQREEQLGAKTTVYYAKTSIRSNEQIKADDVERRQIETCKVPLHAITSMHQLIGRTCQFGLDKGTLISTDDLKPLAKGHLHEPIQEVDSETQHLDIRKYDPAAAKALTDTQAQTTNQYVYALSNHIRQFWMYHPDDTKHRKTSVRLTVNANGTLSDIHTHKTSGDPAYDKTVLSACSKAGAFSKPPSCLDAPVEIELTFDESTQTN
jgi:TonB family protein